MKTLVKALFLSVVLILTACGKKDTKSSIRSARDTRKPPTATAGQNTETNTGELEGEAKWGVITSVYSMEESVKGFVSASSDPNTVGYVSGYENDSTGVRFIGKVKTDDSGQVLSGAVDIVIFDSHYAEQNQDPIVVTLDLISGQINNQRSQIIFGDSYGTVTFDGYFQNGYFVGTVTYQNKQSYDPSYGYSGTLGEFKVDECGFFTCYY